MAKKKASKKAKKFTFKQIVVGGAALVVVLFVAVWLIVGGVTASSKAKAYVEKRGEQSEIVLKTSATAAVLAQKKEVVSELQGYEYTVKEGSNIFAFGNSYKFYKVTIKKDKIKYTVTIPMSLEDTDEVKVK